MVDDTPVDSLIGEAIAEARIAQKKWASQSVGDRAAKLRELRFLATESVEKLVEEIKRIRSVSEAEIVATEMLPFFAACQFLEANAARILRPRKLSGRGRPRWLGAARSRVERAPWGVVLILAPSNYPFFLGATQVIQAAVAGNTVLFKPAPNCSGPAQILGRWMEEAGFPPNLLQILPERVQAADEALKSGVDKVLLTGGSETGRSVLSACAPHLIPATMELSGMDAMIVRADADAGRVAKAVSFGLSVNRGKTCIAPRRIFVHRKIYPKVLESLTERLKSTAFEAGLAGKLETVIKSAIEANAKVISGNYIPAESRLPMLLNAVPSDSPLWLGDHFAAVAALQIVDSDEEALDLLGESGFALGVSIFSEDVAAADRLQRDIIAGVVTINDVIAPTADPRLPFGGRRTSGFGVTRGKEGLLEFTTPRVVIERRSNSWAPHLEAEHPTDHQLFLQFVRMGHSRKFSDRIRGLLGAIKLILQRAS
tara:strand:- start:31863 stop:33314 length:1452 start_codon:yes stop_codon:yes gene_type:complete